MKLLLSKLSLSLIFAVTLFSGFVPLGFSEPLRIQLEQGVEVDQLQCNNDSHVLVQRNNGNMACVYEKTAERIGWEIIQIITKINERVSEKKVLDFLLFDNSTKQKINPSNEHQIDPQVGISEQLNTKLLTDAVDHYSLIPQGTFESAINISKEDVDIFADKISKFIDEPYTKRTEISEGFRFSTNQGSFKVTGDGDSITGFTFTSLPKGITSFEEGEIIRNELIKEFGITLDGTELDVYSSWGPEVHIFKYIQKKDGILIDSNQIRLVFEPDMTFITITNWNDNLSEMNLVDLDTVQQTAIQYAKNSETLSSSPCNITMENRPLSPETITHTTLKIINDTPIYIVYSGTCQISSALMSQDFETYVNALTGEPLFIKRGVSM